MNGLINPSIMASLDSVTKTFETEGGDVDALKDISFDVQRGEFLGLIGRSGSGKTTLLNMIGGLQRPSSGSIEIDEQRLSDMSENEIRNFRLRSLALVYREHLLVNALTVIENVELPMLLNRITADQRHAKSLELLEQFGLTHKMDCFPAQLSDGERQRVCIARALVFDPVLLLADELTGGIDARSKDMIMRAFKEITSSGDRSVIMVSPDFEQQDEFDRVLVLANGQLAA